MINSKDFFDLVTKEMPIEEGISFDIEKKVTKNGFDAHWLYVKHNDRVIHTCINTSMNGLFEDFMRAIIWKGFAFMKLHTDIVVNRD